jgi:hypothetical protein
MSRIRGLLVVLLLSSTATSFASNGITYTIDPVSGLSDPIVAHVTVTTDHDMTASFGCRLTYDASGLTLTAAEVQTGTGKLPASWSTIIFDTSTPGQIDLVATDQTAAHAVIAAGTFEALKITLARKAATCATHEFGFNATRPEAGTPLENAFPDYNQYVQYIDDGTHTILTQELTETPATGPAIAASHAFLRGNVNTRDAHALDIGDVVTLANYLFRGFALGFDCQAAADVNNDGKKNITDLVTLVQGIFNSGLVHIPAPTGTPGVVAPDGGAIPSVLGCAAGEAVCP